MRNKKIKILFFLPHLVGGGAERVTINIIKLLNKELYDITLVVLSKKGPSYNLLPKDLHIIDLNVNKTIFSIFKLKKTIQVIKPNIIFSSIFRGHIALYFSILGINCKANIILRSPNSPKLILERKELNFYMKKLLDLVYKRADKIIAQTPEMKNEIVKYHFINPNKIKVFLNPIDTKLIDNKTKNIKNPFSLNDINIVAAGRIIEQKGFDILIKSMKIVINSNNNFKLYIIGEDVIGEQINLEKLVKKYNLEDNIVFLGYQDNPYKYYCYSDLYVLSSRWEGLPNTILENLYLEKPIVATKCIPFMESLINDKKNGFLVDIENIEQLAEAILKYKELKPILANPNPNSVNNIFKIKEKNEFN